MRWMCVSLYALLGAAPQLTLYKFLQWQQSFLILNLIVMNGS